jgi:hypothetical protein
VSKNSADGVGVFVRRYWPTLKILESIESQ